MLTVKAKDLKENFKNLCDAVYYNQETLIISRPKNANVVMVSEKEYNEMLKAVRNAEYLESLNRSVKQADEGKTVTKTMEELLEMENE